ncbi:MAG: ZIP family metal transporter, partial [Desulfatiglandaceae bacterium]
MWSALLLAAGAGLSTTIGSVLGLAVRRPGPRFIGFILGFSAGVMILISFVELLAKAIETEGVGFLGAHMAFFLGMGGYFLIDLLVPHDYLGQHDHPNGKYDHEFGRSPQALKRTGLLMTIGIAIHNIPEGIAISAPIYTATGSRKKAFLWSFFSGVSEVLGAVLAAIVLMPFLSERLMGFVLAGVAGIMVVIS